MRVGLQLSLRDFMISMQDPWRVLLDQQPRPPPPIPEIGLCRSGGGGGGDDGRSAGDVLFKVPRIPASELSYKRFCLEFMEPNRPVIIQGATEGWAAAHDWVAPDGGVNLAFLRAHFGASLVSVTDTAREHEGCGPCHQMQLADYLDWWEQRQQQEQQQQQPPCAGIEALQLKPSAATPAERAAAVLACSTAAQPAGRVDSAEQAAAAATALPAGGLWYCKDWHLASECPQYQAYTCPAVFADDWLNEWYDADHSKGQQQAGSQAEQHQYEQQEQVAQQRQQGQQQQGQQQQTVTTADYRFVYLGPQGTSTPLHSDVLRSHSWSANVAGRKRWCLLPPRHSHLLLDRRGRDTAWDFDAADPEGQYPGLPKAQQHVLTVVQQPGEALFVPAGWFHTVENLDDCISINHNWVNGHSLHWTWALLRRERAAAEQGIDDCRQLCSPAEFEGLVQRNLGANAGLDYAGLGAMLRCTAGVSLHQLGCAAPAAADGSSGCRRQQQQQEQQQQQQQQQQQHGLAVAAGPTAAALQAAVDSPGVPASPSSCWYHAFRLLRAALVLRELLAEQRQIDSACQQEQQRRQRQQSGQRQAAAATAAAAEVAGGSSVSGPEEDEEPPHAREAAANAACLAAIQQQLQEMGIAL